jgi:5-methyltetrahydropteroyltriglutamate--homocysteine methyltransferase
VVAEPAVGVGVAPSDVLTAVRAEHLGVLARPPRLVAGARAHAEGRLSAEGLGALADLAIFDSLYEQDTAGLDVFTDGQFRRSAGPAAPLGADRVADETTFLREHAPGPFKLAVPSPSARALTTLFTQESHLGAPEHHVRMHTDAVAVELAAARAAGARYVVLEADRYCMFLDPFVRASWRAWGIDPKRLFALTLEADAGCLEQLSSDGTTAGLRLCRPFLIGDRLSTPHRPVAAAVLGSLPYDRLLADLDPDRPQATDLLPAVPAGRSVALGLVGTGPAARLPSYDQLVRYVDAAAEIIPANLLAVGTAAATACDGSRSAPARLAEQRALALVGRVARAVWPHRRHHLTSH